MKSIENEWAEIAGPMQAQGAPAQLIASYRGVFLTGVLTGLELKHKKKANVLESVEYIMQEAGKLMMMEVSNAGSSH